MSYPINPKFRVPAVPAVPANLLKLPSKVDEKFEQKKIIREEPLFILPEYRNQIRKTDSSIASLVDNMDEEDLKQIRAIHLDVEKAMNHRNFADWKIRILNKIMENNLEIEKEQYLTIEEIAILVFYFTEIVDNLIDNNDIIEKYSYPDIFKIYDTFYTNFYTFFNIDSYIYNLWNDEYLKQLKEILEATTSNEKKQKIISIENYKYLCLIDLLVFTPLRRMGDYDNTIDFLRTYLDILVLILKKNKLLK